MAENTIQSLSQNQHTERTTVYQVRRRGKGKTKTRVISTSNKHELRGNKNTYRFGNSQQSIRSPQVLCLTEHPPL